MASETHSKAEDEAFFSEVFRCAPDVMCIVRVADGVMFEVNDAFERISGYARDQLIGRSTRDFPWWPDVEERERVLDMLRERGELRDVEARFSGPAGQVDSLISASPISYRGERCAIWRAADITAQRRAERDKRALEERLRAKQNLERLGLLAGGIAHDFNNLLVGVLGNAEILLRKVSEDSPLRAPLQAIAASAQRMAEHTRELLDYAGHTATKLGPVRLDALLAEAVEHARPLLGPEVELELERRCAGSVWIEGDTGQLTRMFVNLIKNAADASEGRPGSVRVSIGRAGRDAEVCVLDTGSGMDPAVRARMFDPFFSTKRAGRGLGLASTPGIVERHAGSISVETAPERGTNVVLRFPSRESTAKAAPSRSPERRCAGRVLVVDDEAQVRTVARHMLTDLGFDVLEAEDGATALALVEHDPGCCALVLLDATMPGLNGAQTLERLRSIVPELPIVLCSGYSRADFRPLLEREPRTGFLTKPFRLEQLAKAIGSLMPEAGRSG